MATTKKKTTKRQAVKPSKPSIAPSVPSDELAQEMRDLLECGVALEKRVAALEMKVAALERREYERMYPPVKNKFSGQIIGSEGKN